MTFDREGLKRWYRDAMHRRLDELRDLRTDLRSADPVAIDAARAVAQALRGSGATYGYPELSDAAAMVESAPDAAVFRRVEGLIEQVRRLALGDESGVAGLGVEWLELAVDTPVGDRGGTGYPSLAEAWSAVSSRHGLASDALGHRVAEMFGLETAAELEPSKSALRLVPEALIRTSGVLPLRENAETVTVATSDPTSLEVEAELVRLTGRTAVFVISSPKELNQAIARVLDETAAEVVERAPERAPRPPQEAEGEDRVLVVDDDPPARLLARRVLEKGGYDVVDAGNGEEALEVLKREPDVALIVADLNMPRIDGLELIWEVREQAEWAGIPVIVVTGETDEILEAKLIEEGADDYIRKPLDPRLFLARVAATIRRAEH